jgi:hypothetical protein
MQITKKLKVIGWIVLLSIILAAILTIVILSAGKNKAIRDLFFSLKNTFMERIAELNASNVELDKADEKLTAEEKRLLKMIKESPDLIVPDNIDQNDPKAILKWFRKMEERYESN